MESIEAVAPFSALEELNSTTIIFTCAGSVEPTPCLSLCWEKPTDIIWIVPLVLGFDQMKNLNCDGARLACNVFRFRWGFVSF